MSLRAAIASGARIINDVTGFRDPSMIAVAAETGAGLVVMHMQGTPRTMQQIRATGMSWLRFAAFSKIAMPFSLLRELIPQRSFLTPALDSVNPWITISKFFAIWTNSVSGIVHSS